MDLCIRVAGSLCCEAEANTASGINYIPIKINLKKGESSFWKSQGSVKECRLHGGQD